MNFVAHVPLPPTPMPQIDINNWLLNFSHWVHRRLRGLPHIVLMWTSAVIGIGRWSQISLSFFLILNVNKYWLAIWVVLFPQIWYLFFGDRTWMILSVFQQCSKHSGWSMSLSSLLGWKGSGPGWAWSLEQDNPDFLTQLCHLQAGWSGAKWPSSLKLSFLIFKTGEHATSLARTSQRFHDPM